MNTENRTDRTPGPIDSTAGAQQQEEKRYTEVEIAAALHHAIRMYVGRSQQGDDVEECFWAALEGRET
jgi:hypothetical protein